MANPFFQFKQFIVYHDRCAMKVTTDSCVFGAWVAGDMAREERKITTALDIGSGTGLLSLMIAQKNDLDIDAVEIDKEASLQSQENIAASPWKDRIQVENEDARQFRGVSKYDCIVSNPPFYENELTSERKTKNIAHHSEELTRRSYQHHEPFETNYSLRPNVPKHQTLVPAFSPLFARGLPHPSWGHSSPRSTCGV